MAKRDGETWIVRVQFSDGTTSVMGRFADMEAATRHAAVISSEGFVCHVEQGTAAGSLSRQRFDRRRQLIEATQDELAEHGWSALTLANVARRAGVTAAALFNHFESKEDLLRTTLEQMVHDFDTAVAEKIALAPNDPMNLLAALVDINVDGRSEKNLRLWAIFRAEVPDWYIDIVGPSDEADLNILRRVFELLGSEDVDRKAMILKAVLHGVLRFMLVENMSGDEARKTIYAALAYIEQGPALAKMPK